MTETSKNIFIRIKYRIYKQSIDCMLKLYTIFGNHAKCFLRIFSSLHPVYKYLYGYSIFWLKDFEKNKVISLKLSCKAVTYSPKSINSESVLANIVTPPVDLYKFDNVVVNVQGSSILIYDGVIIEDVLDYGADIADYSSGLLLAHNESAAIVKINEYEEFDTGFFLGGNGSWNYYHFLIELLPKLQYYSEASKIMGSTPILVNNLVNSIESFNKILNVALHGIDAEVFFLDPKKEYRIKYLYYLSNVNGVVFNLRKKLKNMPESPIGFIQKDSLDYIKHIGNKLIDTNLKSMTKDSFPRKVFLGRKSIARNYNQAVVYENFKKRGYEMIFPEDHSIEYQIQLFQNAEYIAGPTGGAWTNLVFCEQKANCLCWMEKRSIFQGFSDIAKYSGANLNYMLFSSNVKVADLSYASYSIDIEKLKIAIEAFGM